MSQWSRPPLARSSALVPGAVIAVAVVVGPALLAAPAGAQDEDPTAADGFPPVTDAMLEDPAPGDWLTWRRTPNGWGFRRLHSITY